MLLRTHHEGRAESLSQDGPRRRGSRLRYRQKSRAVTRPFLLPSFLLPPSLFTSTSPAGSSRRRREASRVLFIQHAYLVSVSLQEKPETQNKFAPGALEISTTLAFPCRQERRAWAKPLSLNGLLGLASPSLARKHFQSQRHYSNHVIRTGPGRRPSCQICFCFPFSSSLYK